MQYTGNVKNDLTKRDTPSTNNSLSGISQYIQVLKGYDGRDGALGLNRDKREQGMKGEQVLQDYKDQRVEESVI